MVLTEGPGGDARPFSFELFGNDRWRPVMPDEALGGRTTAAIVRRGDVVLRPKASDPAIVHALLRHLETRRFASVPRLLGGEADGRDRLSFLHGDVPRELSYHSDGVLAEAAALLRRFHDATADMPEVVGAGAEVVCHNDWAPTNAVFVGGVPVGLIDFDTARPGCRLWDLGYSAFTWLDLGNDEISAGEQLRRLALFTAGYAHPGCPAPSIAAFALARQAALAASARARGLTAIADWAAASAEWTALNLVPRLLPAGYPPA